MHNLLTVRLTDQLLDHWNHIIQGCMASVVMTIVQKKPSEVILGLMVYKTAAFLRTRLILSFLYLIWLKVNRAGLTRLWIKGQIQVFVQDLWFKKINWRLLAILSCWENFSSSKEILNQCIHTIQDHNLNVKEVHFSEGKIRINTQTPSHHCIRDSLNERRFITPKVSVLLRRGES